MRPFLLAAALLSSLFTVACATGGAVPQPFPTPGPRPFRVPAPGPVAGTSPENAPLDAPGGVSIDPGRALAGTALGYRGVPYRTGGTDPGEGFDCSGLVWYVFAQNGRPVPRTVAELFRTGTAVDGDELRAGDLVFFNTTGQSPSHVGIALGGEGFVHAPSASGEVRVERLDARYWSERLVGVRRIE